MEHRHSHHNGGTACGLLWGNVEKGGVDERCPKCWGGDRPVLLRDASIYWTRHGLEMAWKRLGMEEEEARRKGPTAVRCKWETMNGLVGYKVARKGVLLVLEKRATRVIEHGVVTALTLEQSGRTKSRTATAWA